MYEELLEYTTLVRHIAHQMFDRLPLCVDVNDLISAGFIGLMDASEKFNPSKGAQFKTYAEFRIRGAILDELRSYDWAPRSIRREINLLANAYAHLEQNLGRPAENEEVAQFLGLELEEFQELLQRARGMFFISLDELFETKREKETEDEYNGRALWEVIADPEGDNFLTNIHLKEVKQILANAIAELSPKERQVIFFYYYEELSIKNIGKVISLTESRITQIHTAAILKLRKKLKERLGDG